ncbi:helix-turn-helix transcriptional regulator [Geodermatophilus sabuli]|uniref:DNA-binding response regulator, NarL/FixJ family, contains REC and HTH domains n=1 Tax=Geodermatophilus sabuli TaxID=1564158 RepID=A0A285EI89_9ACTN|nr:LuxR C-terminal-related transcriptional regulator [Geodermatophilus sabuli]MBB3086627.1 DNA-binding CsgD family transcriptional regulator [Geodermatophilus sabuli]SNX97721.1 DNA-binding response regulator, NarL/FixJ family, contains REC and HTH domains [Geodermatophilus sabuli]
MRSAGTSARLSAALTVRAAAEAAAAGEPLPGAARAEAVLAALESLSACAAAVESWDPVGGRHRTLASSGYAADALAAMESAFHEDPHFPAVRDTGRPLRVCDIPPADRRGPMFDRVIRPARFTDGVSVCLSTGGRYVGVLHASTASGGVDDEAVAWLRLLRADLAGLVDPLAGLAPPGVTGNGGVLAWTPDDGRVLALTPSARPSLLAGGPLAALLHPAAWPSRLGRHLLVLRGGELLGVEARPAGPWVVVEHGPGVPPAGLSLRELEVLCGLAGGETNRMVARSLGVSERTVATHVEHLLAKLGAGNRAAAAAFAVGVGLVRLPG